MSLPSSSLTMALGLLVLAVAASAQGPSATTVVSVSLSGSRSQGTQEQPTIGTNLGLSRGPRMCLFLDRKTCTMLRGTFLGGPC